jgi:hypothetical protein
VVPRNSKRHETLSNVVVERAVLAGENATTNRKGKLKVKADGTNVHREALAIVTVITFVSK